MDTQPTLETVHQAIFLLYNNNTTTDKEKVNNWLEELQKSIYAWEVANELLQAKRDLESCYFAAQTMRTKIQNSFDELPAESHQSLRDSLLEHISQINENTNQVIVKQLCIALSDLALQMTSWQDPVMDLINKFGQSSDSLWPLLEIMTVLPEEVHSWHLRLNNSRREQVMQYFFSIGNTVSDFLEMCLKNCADNSQMCSRIIQCFTSWIAIQAIPFDVTQKSNILAYVFQVLNNHLIGANLHANATECVCVILQDLDKERNEQENYNWEMTNEMKMKELFIYQKIIELEQPYHLSVAHEEMEKSQHYCRIFTELAESFLITMVNSSTPGEPHYSVKILDFALMCVGHHDYEVAQVTFNLWNRLSEILYQKNDERLNMVFRPHIERLLGILCRHCQMEPDHLGLVEEEGGGGQLFAEFRTLVSDLIKDVVFIVGSSHFFQQMFANLTVGAEGRPLTWDSIEAALFVMQAVAKNILPEENEVVPKVVEAILNLPPDTHIAVKHTSILLLGELCEWINSHLQTLDPIINFLFNCLQEKGLGNAALTALESICTACSSHMTSHLPILIQLTNNLDRFAISNNATISFLKGVAKVVSKLPTKEIPAAVKELCWIQARPLSVILETQNGRPERGSKNDPVVWLDRITAIFRNISLPVMNRSDESFHDFTHPCMEALNDMWKVLSPTLNKYQHDANISEHTCKCLRFAIRCVGKYSIQILQELVTQIVQLYIANHHSCFLYLGSILVDEFSQDVENVPGLLTMLEAFLTPTFMILQQPNGLVNHPDTVDDLFRLCDRFIQRAPVPFLHSHVLNAIFDCALMSCDFDHKEANSSVMKFFYDLLNNGRNFENQSDFTIRQQLVQDIVAKKGQSLVTKLLSASVFSMSTYIIPDVSDVLLLLSHINSEQFPKWLEEAIMHVQNEGGGAGTRDQLEEFHKTIINCSVENSKTVNTALRSFARLYR